MWPAVGGRKLDYRPHCRDDACPKFAPGKLIQLRLTSQQEARRDEPAPPPLPSEQSIRQAKVSATPLVSCIMPTYNRRPFVADALACFLAQDYPNLELIVVDDGSDTIADLLPPDPRIRYFHLPGKRSIGEKRNFACEHALGYWIAHWDDDDWHAPDRILRQVQAMQGAITPADRLDLNDPALSIASIHPGNTSPRATAGVYWSTEPFEMVRALTSARQDIGARGSGQPLTCCGMPSRSYGSGEACADLAGSSLVDVHSPAAVANSRMTSPW